MRDLERRRLQRLTHSGEGVHRSQQRIKPRLEVDNLRQHALGRGFALGLIALNLYLVLGFGNLHVQRADGVDQAAEARRCGADVGLKLPIDIKEVGRRLGVRYVLEGSVRKSAGKVRIAGQLIDAVTGAHIWADRFERDLTDVFALQDAVTVAVVSAIEPKLLQTEIALATRRRPANLTAYDFYLRAMQQHYQTTREGLAEALRLAHRALELDPQFGLVAALAGVCHQLNLSLGHANDPQFERKEAVRLFRLALSIDDSDPEILAWASITSAIMVGDSESEIEMADRAVALNPNSHLAWHARGWVYKTAGLPEEAIRSFERCIRMSPIDPLPHRALSGMGMALIELRRFDEAIVAGKRAHHQNPTSFAAAYRCLASAFAHLGRNAEAHEAAARVLELDPAFTISAWIARGGQTNAKLLIEGLRKAGLPE